MELDLADHVAVVTDAVLFPASAPTTYVTGTDLPVDGGAGARTALPVTPPVTGRRQ